MLCKKRSKDISNKVNNKNDEYFINGNNINNKENNHNKIGFR